MRDEQRQHPSNLEETPVTHWLRRLDVGEVLAAQPLWDHSCSRLLVVARQHVPGRVRAGYDEEDVAVSAFHSLFRGIAARRFDLRDRTDVWRLLVTIAERKILQRVRHEFRGKRDVRRLATDSLFMSPPDDTSSRRSIRQVALESHEPTPEFAAEVAESCDALLKSLPDDTCRQIAQLKLENHTCLTSDGTGLFFCRHKSTDASDMDLWISRRVRKQAKQ